MKSKFTETTKALFIALVIAAVGCALTALDRAWLADHSMTIALAAVNGALVGLALRFAVDTISDLRRHGRASKQGDTH